MSLQAPIGSLVLLQTISTLIGPFWMWQGNRSANQHSNFLFKGVLNFQMFSLSSFPSEDKYFSKVCETSHQVYQEDQLEMYSWFCHLLYSIQHTITVTFTRITTMYAACLLNVVVAGNARHLLHFKTIFSLSTSNAFTVTGEQSQNTSQNHNYLIHIVQVVWHHVVHQADSIVLERKKVDKLHHFRAKTWTDMTMELIACCRIGTITCFWLWAALYIN